MTSAAVASSARLSVDVHLIVGQFPGMTAGSALRDAVGHACAAEAAGFDNVWIAEHHFLTYGVCPSALAMAAYVLAATTTIGVGAAGAILSDRHPVGLGEEAAMLYELSGGRFTLGVSPGGPWVDREVFAPNGSKLPSFGESLEVLTRWVSGQPTVAGHGTYFRFPAVAVVPRPGRPVPLHVWATSPAVVDVAAQHGLPVIVGLQALPTHVRTLISQHAQTAARHRHEAAQLSHGAIRLVHVGDTDAAARAAVRESLPRWLASRTTPTGAHPRQRPRDPAAYAQQLLANHAVGSAAFCVDRLANFVEVSGVRRLLLVVEAAGASGRTRDNIDAVGSRVLPELRQLRVTPG